MMTVGAAADDLYRVLALQIDAGAESLVTFDVVAMNICPANLRLRGDGGCRCNACEGDH